MERVVAIGMASILWASQAASGGLPLLSSDAFVRLSVNSQKAVLPSAAPVGVYNGKASLQLFVLSNKRYQVSVAFAGFASDRGTIIKPADTSLRINYISVPVGRRRTMPVLEADRTSHKGDTIPFDLDFRVSNMHHYPAGAYSGQIAVVVDAIR